MKVSEINPSSILQDAFHVYRRNNLTKSQQSFSRCVLGMRPSYYSCMITRHRLPSRHVLESLLSVTKTLMSTFLGNPHFRQPYAHNLNQAFDELEQLVERVRLELTFAEAMDQLEAEAGL